MEKWKEMVSWLLGYVMEKDASDLHITAGVRPYIRVNGVIETTDLAVTTSDECREMVYSILTERQKEMFKERNILDFSYGLRGVGRFRINVYQQRGTIAVAIRRISSEIPSMEELGLPVEPVRNLCERSNGLVLIAGPVGSGKTTTMAAIVDYINQTRKCHIITFEDPIEYVHRNIKSLIHQREIGIDIQDFAEALKYVFREDPDVILIGEMRDLETVSAAVTIAETGHLVLATLHTSDASESVKRIIDVFPASQQVQIIAQLSTSLAGVINQRLIPKIDNSGRCLATEIMIANTAVQNLIRENKIEQIYSHIQMGTESGMMTLNQSLCELIQDGLISTEQAIARSTRPKELNRLLED